MADNGSIFSVEIVLGGWFAPETQRHGWFDRDQLDPVAAASGYTITVLPGSITLAGQSITSKTGRVLAVQTRAINLTGSTVTLRRSYVVAVQPATLSLSGGTIGLNVSRRILVNPASVTLSGSTVSMRTSRRLSINTGSQIALTGGTVGMTVTPAPNHYVLTVDPAAINLFGGSIGMIYSGDVSTASGSYWLINKRHRR